MIKWCTETWTCFPTDHLGVQHLLKLHFYCFSELAQFCHLILKHSGCRFFKFQTCKDNEGQSVFVCVCMSWYLVGHLVGPHGHLFHGHVFHVAAFLFGRPPCGTELDFLRPGRGADFKGHSLTSHQRASIIMKCCDLNKSDTEQHWTVSTQAERRSLKFLSNVLLLLQESISHLAPDPALLAPERSVL